MSFGVMFHHFHDNNHRKTQGSISGKQFLKIINFLKKKYNLINAKEFLNKLNEKKIDNKDVCLTFDDSLKCQIDVAFPILKKKKIQAFFFLYTNAFTSNPSKLEIFRDFRTTCYKKIDFFYKDFFLIFKNKYKKKFKYFEKNFDKKYLIKYPFYTINDKKFRFSRDKVLSVKSYESLMQQLMLKKKYNYANAKKKITNVN